MSNRPRPFQVFAVTLVLLSILFFGCETAEVDKEQVYGTKLKGIPLNLDTGYNVNLFTGDSISPLLVDYSDKVVRTGKKFKINWHIPDPDTVQPPLVSEITKPEIKTLKNRTRQISIDSSQSQKVHTSVFDPDKDSLNIILTGLNGDTIPIGIPVRLKGKKTLVKHSKPVKALSPEFRDKATMNIQHIDVAQGLKSSYSRVITQSKDGNIWIGSDGAGLTKYDGEYFTNFHSEEGLITNNVFALEEDNYGNIWIGTSQRGLVKFDGRYFTHYDLSVGFAGERVLDLFNDSQGRIWVSTSTGGLVLIEGDFFTHIVPFNEEGAKKIRQVHEDDQHNIWISCTGSGLIKYDGQVYTKYGLDEGSTILKVYNIVQTDDRDYLVSTPNGLFAFNEDCLTPIDGISKSVIQNLIEGSKSNIWFIQDNQIFCLSGQILNEYDQKDGLVERGYRNLYVDENDNVWLANFGSGIQIIRNNGFETIEPDPLFVSEVAIGMELGPDSAIWFGMTNGQLIKYKHRQLEILGEQQGIPQTRLIGVVDDTNGNMWFASWYAGLFQLKGSKLYSYNEMQGLASRAFNSILADNKGRIWVFHAKGGISLIEDGIVKTFGLKEGFHADQLGFGFLDKEGNVWFTSPYNGLMKTDGDSMIVYSEKEGLVSNNLTVVSATENELWVGSFQHGVNIIRNDSVYILNEKSGLPNNSIWSLVEDYQKNIWVGTDKGLAHVNRGFVRKGVITNYDKYDGLKATDFVTAPPVLRDQELFMSTGKAILKVDLDQWKISDNQPKSQIEFIEVNNQFYDFNHLADSLNEIMTFDSTTAFKSLPIDPTFSHDFNHLTFHFSALDWATPHKIKYSFYLEGQDDQWSEPSKESKAEYRNLSAGNYVFHLRSIGRAGIWSEPVAYSFTVSPPFWLTWWAYTLYSLAFGIFVYAIYRYQLNKKMAEAEAVRLRDLNNLRTKFFVNISHEFRTPLTLIKGIAEQLKTTSAQIEDKNFADDIQVLERNSNQMLTLVNQILDLSKLDEGLLKLQLEVVDLKDFLEAQMQEYKILIQKRGIQLQFECDEAPVLIKSDLPALGHIFNNLMSNAIKFTNEGLIMVMLSIDNQQVVMAIKDSGIGIKRTDLDQIFNRFYQSDIPESRDFKGTGIGLSLTKEMVELLGGEISVMSEFGSGSTFTVRLPYSKETVLPVEAIQNQEQENTHSILTENSERASILVVEDNADMRDYIARVLSDSFDVTTSKDAGEGLAKALELVPDFIVTDWMMPGMSGPEMIQILKSDNKTSHIPCLILTARGDTESRIEGLTYGAEAYLTKPFDTDELKVQINSLLKARDAIRQFFIENKSPEIPIQTVEIESSFLESIRAVIRENLTSESLNGKQLAEMHNISRSQFARKLKALTGFSITQFIMHEKIILAKNYLLDLEKSISDVAYDLGFSDPAYFSRIFSKEMGMSPSDYRDGIK